MSKKEPKYPGFCEVAQSIASRLTPDHSAGLIYVEVREWLRETDDGHVQWLCGELLAGNYKIGLAQLSHLQDRPTIRDCVLLALMQEVPAWINLWDPNRKTRTWHEIRAEELDKKNPTPPE